MLQSILLAVRQLPDPAFRRPLLLGALGALAALCALGGIVVLISLAFMASMGFDTTVGGEGWLSTGVATAGLVLVAVGGWWLFIPLLLAVSGLFLDGVAAAVEQRFYPTLPPAVGASASAQAWAVAILAAKFGGLTLIMVPLSFLLPVVGMLALWAVAAIGLGEGLFEGVALRRMGHAAVKTLRRQRRGEIWSLGAVLALLAAVPVLNLLVPVLGTAAMTHLLHRGGEPRLAGPV